jgi:hypothetical protein
MPQALRQPNLDAQRSAMKKLEFLIGRWAGEAQLLSGQGEPIVLAQAEDAPYRLDELILGCDRPPTEGAPAVLPDTECAETRFLMYNVCDG